MLPVALIMHYWEKLQIGPYQRRVKNSKYSGRRHITYNQYVKLRKNKRICIHNLYLYLEPKMIYGLKESVDKIMAVINDDDKFARFLSEYDYYITDDEYSDED